MLNRNVFFELKVLMFSMLMLFRPNKYSFFKISSRYLFKNYDDILEVILFSEN